MEPTLLGVPTIRRSHSTARASSVILWGTLTSEVISLLTHFLERHYFEPCCFAGALGRKRRSSVAMLLMLASSYSFHLTIINYSSPALTIQRVTTSYVNLLSFPQHSAPLAIVSPSLRSTSSSLLSRLNASLAIASAISIDSVLRCPICPLRLGQGS